MPTRNSKLATLFLLASSLQPLAPTSASATDLSITPANVKLGGAGAVTQTVTFGETATNGQLVYHKTDDNKYWLADNDAAQATAEIAGVVLVGNSADGQGVIVIAGPITIGATTTAGMNYVASSTAGGLAPVADLDSGDWISSCGHATTTGILYVHLKNYRLQVP